MSAPLPVVSPSGVTPGWLSDALRSRGIDAEVESFRIEQVGTGQLGETRRFHLTYAGAIPENAPAAVVGKFTSDNPVAATSGREMGFYRSEVMFYRELAHRARIRTPAVYVAEIDGDTAEFVLLLEDLAPAVQGDHMRGCELAEAEAALREAALLHAAFWNDRDLMGQDWLYVPEGAQGFYTTELMESSWKHFEGTYAHRMDPEVIRVCDAYIRNHAAWNAPRDFPKTFSHNDFRVDNMLFGGDRVAVVDWQTSNFLGAGMDVAYFLGGAFSREVRREVEGPLLRRYHDDLCRLGVADYTFDHLMADYRHYAFAVLAVAIAATVIVKQTERGDHLFMKMVSDGAYQIIDNDALDVLPR
ncbi:MAG: phosphotransferase [Myxococcales bacterium]|nr:phosphotransferase [Myxococcales bacterium]